MNPHVRPLTASLLVLLILMAGCTAGLDEGSDDSIDCDLVQPGEYVYTAGPLTSYVHVQASQEVNNSTMHLLDLAPCVLVYQQSVPVPSMGTDIPAGQYLLVDDNGTPFIDHRPMRGTSEAPELVFWSVDAQGQRIYSNVTGMTSSNGSIEWSGRTSDGMEMTFSWTPCVDLCFEDGIIGTIGDLSGPVPYAPTNTSSNETGNSTSNQSSEGTSPSGEGTNEGPCASDEGRTALAPGVTTLNFTQMIDGVNQTRSVLVHVPDDINTTSCFPLLFGFHGNNGMPQHVLDPFGPLVDEERFIGVYPRGWERSWNLGREASTADDVAFVEQVAATMATYANVDETRLYAFGNSNGAGLAHKLAIETDLFQAFVAEVTSLTTANLPDANASHPGVMQVLGAEDGLIPIDGGEGVGGHVFLSANDSIATWAAHNGCTNVMNQTLADGTFRILHTGCDNGKEVVGYIVAGAGHGIAPGFGGGKMWYYWNFMLNNGPQ